MRLIVITAKSESSDEYGPWIFYNRPSDEKLKTFLRENCNDEFPENGNGPGDFGSYLYVKINEINAEDMVGDFDLVTAILQLIGGGASANPEEISEVVNYLENNVINTGYYNGEGDELIQQIIFYLKKKL